ncbi:MAG: nucleoside-diphosphate kinase [Candidatus Paceibacterota bacterium]|jgi:nucleoside diphosphate kinase
MENIRNNQEERKQIETINEPENLAVVVIKPDAVDRADEVVRRLEHEGFSIQKRVRKILPEKFVDSRSENFPLDIQKETGKYLTTASSEIILLKGGDDIVEKLKFVTGENTNPGKSDKGSIRAIFGEHFPRKTDDGNDFFRNAIHRPANEEERKSDLEQFRDIL